jgi:hypothetical protein
VYNFTQHPFWEKFDLRVSLSVMIKLCLFQVKYEGDILSFSNLAERTNLVFITSYITCNIFHITVAESTENQLMANIKGIKHERYELKHFDRGA